jgi:hypothetical protein
MCVATVVKAQVLFEGYSKITYQGSFAGFNVQRFEFDTAKKQFVSIYLIKYNESFGGAIESLKAYANEALEPISYTYNSVVGKDTKTIDVKNEKGKLKIVTTTNKGKKVKTEKILPKGAFFSTFLAYVILRNPNGIKTNNRYEYKAIAEEQAEIRDGVATVLSEETYKGVPVFKIQNDYPIVNKKPEDSFLTYATAKLEMLATVEPQKTNAMELMPTPAEAMNGLMVSAENLKLLFGNIPEGKVNPLAATVAPSALAATAVPTPVGAPATTIQLSKPDKLKGLELQEPAKSMAPGKQGARPGLGIQTKSK